MYVDTNVIEEAIVGEGEMKDASRFVLALADQSFIFCIGSTSIRKEILATKEEELRNLFLDTYKTVIHMQAPVAKEVRRIVSKYIDIIGLKSSDALHLAIASFNKADVFLSWNREDIVKAKVIAKIREINQSLKIPTPEIMTPEEFRRRARFTTVGRAVVLF